MLLSAPIVFCQRRPVSLATLFFPRCSCFLRVLDWARLFSPFEGTWEKKKKEERERNGPRVVPKKNRPAVKERRACCGYFFGQLDRMEREVGGTDGGSRIPFFFLSPLLFICASKTHVEGGPFPFESKQLDEWTSRTQFFSFFPISTAQQKERSTRD